MESHKIISVKIVSGSSLHQRWKSPMQFITTEQGEFIDNMPGKQFGFFAEANPGFDWQSRVGQTVSGIKIFHYSGYKWLNK
jgi:hypothetical protein